MRNLLFKIVSSCLLLVYSTTLSVAAQAKPDPETIAAVKAKAFFGYWVADEDAYEKSILKSKQKAVKAGLITTDQISEQAKLNSHLMVMYYGDADKSIMHTINGSLNATYKIVAERAEGQEFDLVLTSEKIGTEKGRLVIDGDRMTLSNSEKKDAPKIVLRRLDKAEALTRIATIKKISSAEDKSVELAKLKKKLFTQKPAKVTWIRLDKSIEELKKDYQGKNVMIFFHADWCVTCQLVKKHLQTPEILKTIEANKVQLVSADLTGKNALAQAELKKLMGNEVVPSFVLIDSKGNITKPEIKNYLKDTSLLKLIEKSFAVKK